MTGADQAAFTAHPELRRLAALRDGGGWEFVHYDTEFEVTDLSTGVRTWPDGSADASPEGVAVMVPATWRGELIARADAVVERRGDREAMIRCLVCEIAVFGWPVRSSVGEDGAEAGLLLAAQAAAPYRAGWLPKVLAALRGGEVPCGPARMFVAQVVAERAGR
jgi:hypothetical protein